VITVKHLFVRDDISYSSCIGEEQTNGKGCCSGLLKMKRRVVLRGDFSDFSSLVQINIPRCGVAERKENKYTECLQQYLLFHRYVVSEILICIFFGKILILDSSKSSRSGFRILFQFSVVW
jgi:hypothetical protein